MIVHGRGIEFWYDVWSKDIPLSVAFPDWYSFARDNNNLLAEYLRIILMGLLGSDAAKCGCYTRLGSREMMELQINEPNGML